MKKGKTILNRWRAVCNLTKHSTKQPWPGGGKIKTKNQKNPEGIKTISKKKKNQPCVNNKLSFPNEQSPLKKH